MNAAASPAFVHLRLHSEYSIEDGIVRLDDAIDRAAADGMPALALTDLANVFGMVKFYSAARKAGVKPMLGCDVWVSNEADRDKPFRALLLCRDRAGYGRLCELLTRAYLGNKYRGRAEVRRAWFAKGGGEGLIVLSGAMRSDVGQALLAGNRGQAEKLGREWAAALPGAYYIELQRAGHPQTETYIRQAVPLAAALKLPVVATHPVQFLGPTNFKAHEARVCIAQGYVLGDKRRPRDFTEEQYFKSQAEMGALFSDLPEALANSVEIAKRCNLSIELGRNYLPPFPKPAGVTLDEYFVEQARGGLEQRLRELYPESEQREAKRAEYEQRLEFECETIIQMGYPGYFLIVADFINWGKKNGVPVGPGRGSGAGSLVAYSLGITDLDPLRYGLLFERFLNPERVSMPDFDIDFCQDNRWKVIEYVREKYGAQAVSQIATFGTMASKAVIRDVGRVLDMSYNFCDQLSKLIPVFQNKPLSLKDAREQEPLLKEREENEEEVRELLALSDPLEGLTRNVGMHAGGVLIAPGKLTDFCPLYLADGSDAASVSQFDKDDVEALGLVKFDFLGLRTLTILDEAARLAFEVEGVRIELDKLPLDDRETYDKVFKTANTTAVFQFESRGMKDMLLQAKPDRLEDLIALNALYRPGPMDLIPSFIARKHGREPVAYLHPLLEKVLANTYGIMVYQEQVMQTAQVVAGYSLGGADLLRRAMGKKKPEEMAEQREVFVAGAAGNGIGAGKANEIFDYIEKFAGYGFNKSHAAAYSLVAYQTAWLKCHHPAAFMAATLSSEMADTDKVQFFFDDAVANGLQILPPDINASEYRFRPVDGTHIRYGLGAIKGTGEQAVNLIVKARKADGPFTDLFDFCRRVDKRMVNRRAIEALVRAGAFDSIDPSTGSEPALSLGKGQADRAKLLASVGVAMEAAEQAQQNAHQGGLFEHVEGIGDAAGRTHYVQAQRWSERERLLQEKQAIGFFLSGHPFNEFRNELSRFARRQLAQLEAQKDLLLIAGIVVGTRTQMTRRGKMAFVTIDDGSAKIEVSVFNELYDTQRAKIVVDEVLVVEGKVQKDDFTGGLRVVAEKLMTLGEARGRFATALKLSMNGESKTEGRPGAAVEKLRALLAPFRNGPCPVRLRYRNSVAQCELPLGEAWRVRLDEELLRGLRDWLRPENIEIEYR